MNLKTKINNTSFLQRFLITFFLFSQILISKDLNVQQSLDYALSYNTGIKLSYNSVRIAKAQSNEAKSLAMPKISGFVSSRHNFLLAEQIIEFNGQSTPIKFGQDNSISIGVNVDQILFEGRVFSALRSSKIYTQLSRMSQIHTTSQIIEKTKRAFYLCLLAKQSYYVIEKSYIRSISNYESTRTLFEKGQKREFDMIQSESLVAKRKSDMMNAEKSLQISIENLKKIIGIPLDSNVNIIGNLDIGLRIDLDFEALQKTMLDNQPLLQQANYNLKLMKENIRYNRSSFLPGLYLNGSYGISQSFDNDTFSSENFNRNTYIGLNIALPIFEFSNFAKLDKSKAEYEKANYNKIDLEQNLILELKSLFLTFNETKQKISSAQKQLELAIKGQSASKKLFDRGMITQIEFEAAELSLLQAELQIEQVKFEYLTTIASIERSIGSELGKLNE